MNLSNHLLVSVPQVEDPHFERSVVLICRHDEDGAMGIIINHPTPATVYDLLETVEIEPTEEFYQDDPILYGGPIESKTGFVIHQPAGPWRSTLHISPILGLTTSKDILEAIAMGAGPERILVSTGCAGWEPGQLEEEMYANDWLVGKATTELLFDVPFERRWKEAAKQIGVKDIMHLTQACGHA